MKLTNSFENDLNERIPTGFRIKAQGCAQRATLGGQRPVFPNPNGVETAGPSSQPRWDWRNFHRFTQGSSSPVRLGPTLGCMTQSRWDWHPECGRPRPLQRSIHAGPETFEGLRSLSHCSARDGRTPIPIRSSLRDFNLFAMQPGVETPGYFRSPLRGGYIGGHQQSILNALT
jgi:hypothetical protein